MGDFLGRVSGNGPRRLHFQCTSQGEPTTGWNFWTTNEMQTSRFIAEEFKGQGGDDESPTLRQDPHKPLSSLSFFIQGLEQAQEDNLCWFSDAFLTRLKGVLLILWAAPRRPEAIELAKVGRPIQGQTSPSFLSQT